MEETFERVTGKEGGELAYGLPCQKKTLTGKSPWGLVIG